MAKASPDKTNQAATVFYRHRAFRALVGILSIGLGYLSFLYAIDSGNLLAYVAIGVFAFIALREFFASVDWRKRG